MKRASAAVLAAAALACAIGMAAGTGAMAGGSSAATQAPDPEQILKKFTVVGDAQTRPLPKIAVVASLASNIEDITLHNVVRRDLDLCGEFDLLPEGAAPDPLGSSGDAIDLKGWKNQGAEAVVKISGRRLAKSEVELRGVAYLIGSGDKPVFDKRLRTTPDHVRTQAHRVADAIIGALTGTPGGFSSQMTFIYGIGKLRRVYVVDSDGHNPHPVSAPDQTALSPAFGPDQRLYYAASIRKDAYKIMSPGHDKAIGLSPRGSVYGIAFSRDRSRVAVSIARGPGIQLFAGRDLFHLEQASRVDMALHPTFSPSGKLAFSGAGRWGQRIYVDGKAASPPGLNASAPVFCRHPDGIRLIYMVGVGKNTDLVAAPERGGHLARLTQHRGRNGYPACSPDGRLIAFFSTRKGDEGPGLYIMRIDGYRPKRISSLVGDSLRWARLPADK